MSAMTYRPSADLAERLRAAAFVARRSKQSIIDEALADWLDTKGREALDEYRRQQKRK